MKYPIDIILLDKNQRIVKLWQNIKPNRLIFWNPIYSQIIELPGGSIKKTRISMGDKIITV